MTDTDPGLDEAFEQALQADADAHVPERPDDVEAPYGWIREKDGTLRPKKTAGRPRKPPSVDELKAERERQPLETEFPTVTGTGTVPGSALDGDRPPEKPRRRHRATDGSRGGKPPGRPSPPAPQFREGQIAGGMNRLYRRAGKMLKVFDQEIGQAFIEATRKEDEADITVGEAWEEVARGNPRIRRFLLRMISGGAYGQLFMAHAPILLVIMMKPAVQKRLPFNKLVAAFLDNGDTSGEAPAAGTPFEGLRPEDVEQMQAAAMAMAAQMMNRQPQAGPRAPTADGQG
jgi:hypothetical protein